MVKEAGLRSRGPRSRPHGEGRLLQKEAEDPGAPLVPRSLIKSSTTAVQLQGGSPEEAAWPMPPLPPTAAREAWKQQE